MKELPGLWELWLLWDILMIIVILPILISVSTVLHSLVKTIVLLLSGLQVYAGI